ncbi:MAG TPA: helix-turn-helix domain-containing protein [Candidatus Cybelea sp.]|nr:helix-turn-helix domain-containing protein [Candidatus Cybelea sp.]
MHKFDLHAHPVTRREKYRRSTRIPVALDDELGVLARPQERTILLCLQENVEFLVPYETLCAALGYETATAKERHALHQHVMTLRRLLSEHKVPYAVAGIEGVGYTLVREAKKLPSDDSDQASGS